MGWQQDGVHGAAHRSSDRSLASNWPSRQIGGSIRGYPVGPSARWPARRAQSTIIAQADTLYSSACRINPILSRMVREGVLQIRASKVCTGHRNSEEQSAPWLAG